MSRQKWRRGEMMHHGRGPAAGLGSRGVDEAVLAELRAIRAEIRALAEKLAGAATREDLADYVTREAFGAHVAEHERQRQGLHFWAPYLLSVVSLAFWVVWTVGSHVRWQ